MKKIFKSVLTIGAAGLLAFGASQAFFSDTETSTGNTFQAGALDLKVDSEAHYNGLVCRLDDGVYRWLHPLPGDATPDELALEHYGDECNGTWTETDLGVLNKFFDLHDVKPGDDGENTISLHVYDNDAWGRFLIRGVSDLDNSCTEPETEVGAGLDPECGAPTPTPNAPHPSGELGKNISFYAWLDQGSLAGFQNGDPSERPVPDDPGEGDNIRQCETPNLDPDDNDYDCDEPLVILPGGVEGDENHNIWQALSLVYSAYCESDQTRVNGHNDYGYCHGIALDGRMVGSTTYYFGLAWSIPDNVGNEAQTDSLEADLVFEVEQHRNNPNPFQ